RLHLVPDPVERLPDLLPKPLRAAADSVERLPDPRPPGVLDPAGDLLHEVPDEVEVRLDRVLPQPLRDFADRLEDALHDRPRDVLEPVDRRRGRLLDPGPRR